MKFKPTTLKVIFSIILGFVLGLLLNNLVFSKLFSSVAVNMTTTEEVYFYSPIIFWIVEIIFIIVTYIIWSLIQKKK
jgi:hypothetical protein